VKGRGIAAGDRLAVDEERAHLQGSAGLGDQREARGPVNGVAGEERAAAGSRRTMRRKPSSLIS
jgi:hypothetical protein